MSAEETIRAYYDTVRTNGQPGQYFADERGGDATVVKFGISESLVGIDAVRDGLAEQTATTENWSLESRDLRVTQRDDYAWFSDSVRMAWTDMDEELRHEFESRWSGTLERRPEWESALDTPWRFVGMHVSAPTEL
jgi:hypothetical protein